MTVRPRMDAAAAEPTAAPPVAAALPPDRLPAGRNGWTILLVAAFAVSLSVHAAAIAWIVRNWNPPQGLKAAEEPVTVAILLDDPAIRTQQAIVGEEKATEEIAPETVPPQKPVEATAIEPITPPAPPAINPEAGEPVAARETDDQAADEVALSVVLPDTDVPIPARRPVQRSTPPRQRETTQREERATRPAERIADAPPRRPATEQRRASTAGRAGGATAGAEAGFARRLLAHVERHKRYPPAAARQRITGATRLSITINRSGGLSGARITARSGHAILDDEALAVARRAAPYPRPPEGVGGATISFAVTLRFNR